MGRRGGACCRGGHGASRPVPVVSMRSPKEGFLLRLDLHWFHAVRIGRRISGRWVIVFMGFSHLIGREYCHP